MMIEGRVTATVKDALTGRVLYVSRGKNLLVTTGRNLVRSLLGGTAIPPTDLKVGTGTTSPAAGDTDLETAVLTKIIDRRLDVSFGVTFQSIIGTGEANGNTLSEVGTFSGLILVARALITPTISKTAAIQVTLEHTFTVASS